MGLDSLVRNAVALANGLTGTLQVNVVHKRWIAQDDAGKSVFASSVTRLALLEKRQKVVRMASGEDQVAQATVSFLSPIPPYTPTVTGRQDPVDGRDVLVLPDGTTGPILRQDNGLVDPVTGRTYLLQVVLG